MSGKTGDLGVPLSEWIRSFETVSSAEYLLPALRLACAITDEICKVKEVTGRSPTPRFDWAGNIAVSMKSNRSTEEVTANLFDNIILGDSGGEDIIRVELLPSLFDEKTDNNDDARTEDGTLYSLGVVLFEIFSRGERPAELEQKQSGERPTGVEDGDEELLKNFNPFHQDGATIDPAALSMHQNLLSDYNLSDDDSTSYDFTFQEGDGDEPRKKRTQNENFNMCSISVEPLKEKGVPVSLCDLIANMLDDTLCKDETYNDISEVRDDLQLMLDRPSIYLYDQDMGLLSTTGLQIGGTVSGRNAELSAIIDSYRRTVSGDSELVTIYGNSGTGKTTLAHEFGKFVVSNGGIFLIGKFDQRQQGRPFSALASAFDEYCGILLWNSDLAPSKQKLATQINHVLGSEARHLAKLIPNLGNILGLGLNSDDVHHEECSNAQNRLQYLLCRFVEVLSGTFAAAVTLFLDDLQWADSASIAAVNQLLLPSDIASQNKHFFFLGCYREGETEKSNTIWKSLCNSDLVNARSIVVKLGCMDEEALTMMISETLCLLPRLTRSLSSIIYRKTKGDPLFVSRLMISLNKEGLLRPSLSRRRWEWDKEKILCQKLPDDVAEFLSDTIEALPDDVKATLRTLSCFGASVSCSFVKTLERAINKPLLDSIDTAVAEGLLDKIDDQYRFSHDRIQEAAYKMLDIRNQGRSHFSYGMALAPLVAREGDDSVLFAAVNQLNLAGPEAVQEKSQYVKVAELNLQAGKKAMEMSDFALAYSYFDHGISFLRKNHWEEHYALSLELFDLAAECALTNGDAVSLKLLSQQVIAKGRLYEDKLNVMYYATCSLASSFKLPESIEKGLDILAHLGIRIRGNESSMEDCVHETKALLSGYSDEEILITRRMTNPTLMMAMKFLGKLEMGMTQIMPKSAPHVMQQIIHLSLDHGMSPVSPIGFVHLGSYMAKLGDISGGYHYVKLARSLLDKLGAKESAGEVIFIGTHIRSYVEPLQSTLGYNDEGYAAAMASGDIIQAALNILCGYRLFFIAGTNLQQLHRKSVEAALFMRERKMLIFLTQIHCLQLSISKLIGTDDEPKFDSAEEKKIFATNNSVRTSLYFERAYISFIFRSYDDMKNYTEQYLKCAVNTWANLFYAHFTFHAYYIGLISFWLARKSTAGHQWLESGKNSKLALKKWAESSLWTFENRWYLLEAEESYCNNDFDVAKLFYDKP